MENTDIADGIKEWKLMKAPKSHWSNIPQYDMTSMGIAPFIDKKNGKPKTGLSAADARRLENELGMEPNELAPRSEFWRDFQVKADAKIQRFDLSDPEEELAFLFLKGHKLVAFGHAELKKKPHAMYVLYNDVDEARAKVKVGNIKKDAYKYFIGMDTAEMIDILMVMGKPIVSRDPSIIEAMMGRVVETEARTFLDIAGDKNFKMKLFVLKCVHFDILTRSRGKDLNSAMFSFNEDFLAEGIDKVVGILNAKANQKLFLALQKRLEMAISAGTLANAPILSGYEIEEAVASEAVTGPKAVKDRGKITSKAASGKGGANKATGTKTNTKITDNSVVKEVTGDGNDSGDFNTEEAPEII